jgi:tRNA C32,U32 (ribose-2'-O)-methylase TrmJ
LRLRRLYLRARLDQRELRLLHGILSDTDRIARRDRNVSEPDDSTDQNR